MGGPIAWSAFVAGAIVALSGLAGVLFGLRSASSSLQRGAPALGSPLAVLAMSLVTLAGLLLLIYSLNLSGNLGR